MTYLLSASAKPEDSLLAGIEAQSDFDIEHLTDVLSLIVW
jgi:hypothetical protein